MEGRILVVDDDAHVLRLLADALGREGYRVTGRATAREGRETARTEPFDCAVLDLHIGDADGVELMKALKGLQPGVEVVVITGDREVDAAVRAVKAGAFDYLTKPLSLERLSCAIRNACAAAVRERELGELRAAVRGRDGFDRILGRSEGMRRAIELARRAAPSDAPVLLTGESGTGKELFARAIHAAGRRAAGPFVAVNCAAIPETLAESELFGHEAGAFTGAVAARAGRFEEAHGGTLFLDELEAMPASIQPKLLRALQEKTSQRVGGARPYASDARVVAATNRDLEGGGFREDVFHRVAGVSVRVPPLRERGEDLPMLADHFLREAARREGRTASAWSPEAVALLVRHRWTGNVRELQNVATHAVLVCDGDAVRAEHLPDRLRGAAEGSPATTLDGAVEALERWLISDALRRSGGVQAKAAELLGTTPRVVGYKAEKYGLK